MKTPEQMADEYANNLTRESERFIRQDVSYAFFFGYAAAQPKWISVKERLPDYNQDVLFCSIKYKDCFVGYRAELDAYVDPEGNGLTDDLIFKYYNFWMPLPEPPKENE